MSFGIMSSPALIAANRFPLKADRRDGKLDCGKNPGVEIEGAEEGLELEFGLGIVLLKWMKKCKVKFDYN